MNIRTNLRARLRTNIRTNLRTNLRARLHGRTRTSPTGAPTTPRARTGRIAAPVAAGLAVLAAAGCGISPTGVRDGGRPPVISYSPTWVTVYMVDDGTLQPVRIPVASDSTENVVKSLFRAGQQPPRPGLTSELTGFDYYDIKTTRYTDASQRSEPTDDLGYRLNVIVTGEGRVTRLGLAQITCTVRQNKQASIWSVEITRLFPGAPESLGEHSCSEYQDLAGRGVRLPP